MAIGRSQVCSYFLGALSALSFAVVVFCLKSNSLVWPSAASLNSLTVFGANDGLNDTAPLLNLTTIPHILHQSWINNTIPHRYTAWRQSWVTNHKHWEFKLWTDDDNEALVKQYAPWFLQRYREFEEPVMRADSARYLYMYRCRRLAHMFLICCPRRHALHAVQTGDAACHGLYLSALSKLSRQAVTKAAW